MNFPLMTAIELTQLASQILSINTCIMLYPRNMIEGFLKFQWPDASANLESTVGSKTHLESGETFQELSSQPLHWKFWQESDEICSYLYIRRLFGDPEWFTVCHHDFAVMDMILCNMFNSRSKLRSAWQ